MLTGFFGGGFLGGGFLSSFSELALGLSLNLFAEKRSVYTWCASCYTALVNAKL